MRRGLARFEVETSRGAAGDQLVALAGGAVLHPGREVPSRHPHGGDRPLPPAAAGLRWIAAAQSFRFRISPETDIAGWKTDAKNAGEGMEGQPSRVCALVVTTNRGRWALSPHQLARLPRR